MPFICCVRPAVKEPSFSDGQATQEGKAAYGRGTGCMLPSPATPMSQRSDVSLPGAKLPSLMEQRKSEGGWQAFLSIQDLVQVVPLQAETSAGSLTSSTEGPEARASEVPSQPSVQSDILLKLLNEAAKGGASARTNVQQLQNDLKNLVYLGRGAWGKVYRAEWRGAPVAVKLVPSNSTEQLQSSVMEAIVNRILAHPNVVHTYTATVLPVEREWVADPEPQPLTHDHLRVQSATSVLAASAYRDLVSELFDTTQDNQRDRDSAGLTHRDSHREATTTGRESMDLSRFHHHNARQSIEYANNNSPKAGISAHIYNTRPNSNSETQLQHRGSHSPGHVQRNTANGDTPPAAREGPPSLSHYHTSHSPQNGNSLTQSSIAHHNQAMYSDHAVAVAAAQTAAATGTSPSPPPPPPPSGGGNPRRNSARSLDFSFGNSFTQKTAQMTFKGAMLDLNLSMGQYVTCIVMEHCDRGSLTQAIKRGVFLPSGKWGKSTALRALVRTAKEIAQGLAYLHANNIIHGDLKPGNVLLKSARLDRRGFTARISDFGYSAMGGPNSGEISTPHYMAPEAVDGRMLVASDVYSFGVLLWQMATGMDPFGDMHWAPLLTGILSGDLVLEWPNTVHPVIRKLGAACLSFDPAQRPTSAILTKVLNKLEDNIKLDAKKPRTSSGKPSPPASFGSAASNLSLQLQTSDVASIHVSVTSTAQ